jgi:hypothetical protein
MSSGNSRDILEFGLSTALGVSPTWLLPPPMESFVSADLGASGGSYNPDEEEDESSGN